MQAEHHDVLVQGKTWHLGVVRAHTVTTEKLDSAYASKQVLDQSGGMLHAGVGVDCEHGGAYTMRGHAGVMQTVHPQEDAWVAVWEGRACRCRQRKQQATRQGIKYKQRLRLPQGEAMPEANRLAITISKNRKAHCGKPLHTAKSP
eukprot:1158868-Pelagomonas_calceolata.AAC.4